MGIIGNPGPQLRGAKRREALQAARQWRIDNKPYFDAIYGPDDRRPHRRCLACNGFGVILRSDGCV